MPEFQTVRLHESGQGLFSAADVERLMRAEFDRATRYKFPLVLMLLAVDRLDQLQDLYGWESKDEILRAVVAVLRGSMRDSDLLGLTQDDRILLAFPHTTPEAASLLAKRLLTGARKLHFDRDGRTLRISLSIGISHNRQGGDLSFETLVAVAEDGLTVADSAGGDRVAETELYQLYERKRRARLLARERTGAAAPEPAPVLASVPRPEPAPQRPTPSGAMLDDPLGQALLELLGAQGLDRSKYAGLDPQAVAAAIQRAQEDKLRSAHTAAEAGASQAAEKDRHIENLERRIAKLTQLLGLTEEELRRVAQQKGVEFGLPSIYKTVQGLSGSEPQADRKKEMMRTIFEANLEMRKALLGRDPEPAPANPRGP